MLKWDSCFAAVGWQVAKSNLSAIWWFYGSKQNKNTFWIQLDNLFSLEYQLKTPAASYRLKDLFFEYDETLKNLLVIYSKNIKKCFLALFEMIKIANAKNQKFMLLSSAFLILLIFIKFSLLRMMKLNQQEKNSNYVFLIDVWVFYTICYYYLKICICWSLFFFIPDL